MRPLSVEIDSPDHRPYFLWNEDLSGVELRERLRNGDPEERDRLLAILLREARDIDVWHFVSPHEVAEAMPRLAFRLGRRRAFWEFLIGGWREDGLLDA